VWINYKQQRRLFKILYMNQHTSALEITVTTKTAQTGRALFIGQKTTIENLTNKKEGVQLLALIKITSDVSLLVWIFIWQVYWRCSTDLSQNYTHDRIQCLVRSNLFFSDQISRSCDTLFMFIYMYYIRDILVCSTLPTYVNWLASNANTLDSIIYM